ncbi:MAG: hypothetical protein M8349_07925 [ANME-2 cluster archaeon]|nr:hypothetical protein [ANME-2 cluster archaeon]
MRFRDQIRSIGAVPEPLLHLVPNRFEVVGDVVVIAIPPRLETYKQVIVETITRMRKNIRTVLNKVAMLEGEARLGDYEILSGNDTITPHREYGHLYLQETVAVPGYCNGV